MRFNKQNILGVEITSTDKDNILKYINKGLLQAGATRSATSRHGLEFFTIVTPNPEQIVMATKNTHYRDILNKADVALPDGVGVVQAARILDHSGVKKDTVGIHRRIPGVEFMEDLVCIAQEQRVTMGLIGGRDGVAVKALECLRTRYPGSRGWAIEAPELAISENNQLSGFSEDWIRSVTDTIISSKARLVFIGLGAPKQEYLMDLIRHRLQRVISKRNDIRIVAMSVGGSFEILSGTIQRAPVIIRKIGLEWFWRLVNEPWRWKRQLALITFIGLVIRKRLMSITGR